MPGPKGQGVDGKRSAGVSIPAGSAPVSNSAHVFGEVFEIFVCGCAGDRLRLLPQPTWRSVIERVSIYPSRLPARVRARCPRQFANLRSPASRSNPSNIISQSIASPCAPQPKQ